MSHRRTLWLLSAAAHLAIVLCGACYCLPDYDQGSAAGLIRWYGTTSGAGSSYGFFAPEVGVPHRARFVLRDEQGGTWSDSFDRASTNEARLRLTGIVVTSFMSGDAYKSAQWREKLVKSWAATMFTRHSRAVELTVVVEAYDVPNMAAYRTGSRPGWQTVYEARLRRDSSPVNTARESRDV